MTDQRRALVTGGAGFVGLALVPELVGQGYDVWVLDDFSVGRRETLEGQVRCQVITGSVADADAVARAMEQAAPHVVFHLAAMHFVPQCEREPLGALTTNVLGTQAVLDAAARIDGCRLVFASTADVYAPSAEPHTEESPLGSPTMYGITKTTGEHLVRRAMARGLDARVARLFNVLGPGDRTPHVLPDIVNSLVRRGELRLGNLDPIRDYVFVGDVARALVRLGEYAGPEAVFNIGSGVGRSVRDLVDAVLRLWGGPAPLTIDAAKVRPVERPVLVCDAGRARRLLGWEPVVPFERGLTQVMAAATPGASA